MVLTTTFERLRAAEACKDGYQKLAKHLGGVGKYGLTTPINLLVILESNGVDDCLWCLRATEQDCESLCRHMACDFAELALPIFEKQYPDDGRPRQCVEVARRYADGTASRDELAAAREAASAAWEAASAAWEVASAAWEAASAAWEAREAAREAASAARAAWDAAMAAAWAAARDTARAAWAAASAAWAAASAASAAREAQKEIIQRYLSS